jgi:regulatory protein
MGRSVRAQGDDSVAGDQYRIYSIYGDGGLTVEEGEIEALVPTPRMLAWSRNSTLYRLSRRMMTERELSDAIARKSRQKFEGISEAQVKALSAAAVEFGRTMLALDDTAYAEIRTRSSARGGKSKRAIGRKLIEKGIDREIVQQALEETDDFLSALVFARKRAFGPFRRPDVEVDDKRRAKEFSAFARNGFGFEIGRRVMAMEREEAEEILADRPFV